MAVQFGKTWWGEHWLLSLKNVDYDNRLPRGASYARKGSVLDIKLQGNLIYAQVAGSRPKPYKIQLIVPPFSEKQKENLMEGIISRPALISKLLNRELDPEILKIAENAGLRVFPRQWSDFEMTCSCPDWAVPCKHLAAVIYMLSREIDNNPFIIFEIHNINLIEELKNRGIFIADQKKNEILLLSKLLEPSNKSASSFDENRAYDQVDFAQLHNITDSIVQLLPDSPPFYSSGNFKEKFKQQFIRNTKEVQRILAKKLGIEAIFPNRSKKNEISYRSTFSFTINADNELSTHSEDSNIKDISQLIPSVFQLNPDHLPDYQASVAAIHSTLLASLHLIANGNIVPQIVQLNNKKYMVRWVAALIDNEVRLLIEKLDKILPPEILLTPKTNLKNQSLASPQNLSFELISVFLTTIITRLSNIYSENLMEEIFFNSKPYSFSGVGENALSGGIKVWLNRFHLNAENFKPIITVTELDNDRFDVKICIEDVSKPAQLPVELFSILSQKKHEKDRYRILQTLSLLSPFINKLDNHINNGARQPIIFGINEFSPFLMEMLPAIRLLNIKILLPKSLQTLLRPKTSVKLKQKQAASGFIRLNDLLEFDWQVALGDIFISPEEFNKLINHATGLIRFKQNYIYVNEVDIEKLNKIFNSDKILNSYQLLHAALSEEYDGAPIILTDEVRNLIQELTSDTEIDLPAELIAQLRPYQRSGYSWMYKNSRIGFGSIIADDMGLGKTIQVISLLLKFKEEKMLNEKHKALVVVPTGLLTNWQAEITKFAPSLSTHIYHGTTRLFEEFTADILLTTYGVLRSDTDLLKKQKWQVLVIDEAQNIKNHNTAQSKATKSISANIRIAMSGTPVENRLSDFWSIMDFTNKGYLGNAKSFNQEYAEPIQVYNDEKTISKFRKITSPFMLRRMKTDKAIISDLPNKIEQNQFALLTKQQVALYEKTMQAAMNEIEGFQETENSSLFKRQGLILQMILALKQICNHPTHFLKNGNYDSSLSGKTQLLLELLNNIVEAGDKVLVFTQFREMGDLLQHFISELFGETPMFYHGGCNIAQRNKMVERFQNNRADKIFILSLKAAGTGLNLTAASHVIHYDLWWNPAVENQATDRAFRIGQQKNVMVHRLITKNTFEERIDQMIQNKKQLAEMTVSTGENWIGKLSNKELREIFK